MGMLDDKMYLTGDKGAVSVGEEFSLKGARVTGPVTVSGQTRTEVALRIERAGDASPLVVYTTGTAIVNQVQRMDTGDQNAMRSPTGMLVKLVQRGGGEGRNPAYVLATPDAPDHDSSDPVPSDQDW